jgi:mevalonate kinase
VLSEGGCDVPSLMEALEARRAEVLGQAERLREQIAGLSEELSRAEERLSRLQIARETVEEVLAAPSSPVPGTDAAGGGTGGVAVALVKAEAELDVTVMSPEYREIIALFATSGAAMRCKEVCLHLGLGSEPRHVEGMRSKLKRLVSAYT